MVTPKADVGFMLITPDLQVANRIEKQLTLSLRRRCAHAGLQLFVTDRRERIHHERRRLRAHAAGGTETQAGISRVRAGDEGIPRTDGKYRHDRVYPTLPDWPVVCFYNMSKRRGEAAELVRAAFRGAPPPHARPWRRGREYAGKVKQLITGSTGLDDAEWGVTLFAHDTFQIKSIVYEMRFDAVSAQYADFGEFYVGIQLPLDELFDRLQL